MAVDIEKLKAGGFIAQCEKDLFSLRVRIPCGNVTSDEIKLLSDISEKYGNAYLHITVRQGFEIPHIHITNIDKVAKELENGNILQIMADDPMALEDIPSWAKKNGHKFLKVISNNGVY